MLNLISFFWMIILIRKTSLGDLGSLKWSLIYTRLILSSTVWYKSIDKGGRLNLILELASEQVSGTYYNSNDGRLITLMYGLTSIIDFSTNWSKGMKSLVKVQSNMELGFRSLRYLMMR
jgi:hypothetical protein